VVILRVKCYLVFKVEPHRAADDYVHLLLVTGLLAARSRLPRESEAYPFSPIGRLDGEFGRGGVPRRKEEGDKQQTSIVLFKDFQLIN